jgi:hypothetical protein
MPSVAAGLPCSQPMEPDAGEAILSLKTNIDSVSTLGLQGCGLSLPQ